MISLYQYSYQDYLLTQKKYIGMNIVGPVYYFICQLNGMNIDTRQGANIFIFSIKLMVE